ncbi:conserved Plasmodium protein, unknown function [Plasmodium malariae]|uniref:Helicase ATP-binding domain-containing protein n=2 Tax=Plasmodium malariae TaxID=5858 RepID=A0A1D3TDW7_PLAMA|nr:conserved Plasmodium protein, unknown function [Plasmodium malariae]SCP03138.1 conserved Plasmodium protein, unknown function [Plasmodium malariae]
MENNLNENLGTIKDFSLFKKLKESIIKGSVNELYKILLGSMLENINDSDGNRNHIICNYNYAEAVYFFYVNLIIEKQEFASVFCKDKTETNRLEYIVEHLKGTKLKHEKNLENLKNIITKNIDSCQKCLMIYYLLQKKFIENISLIIKNEETLINFIKREIFKFNFNRIINKITCPKGYDNVDYVVLELMLNGAKVFQVDFNYQLDTSKLNKVNLQLFTEKFLNLDSENIYNIIQKYAAYESLNFFCNLIHSEFKKSKKLLIKVNQKICKLDYCINNENLKVFNKSELEENVSEQNCDSYKNESLNIDKSNNNSFSKDPIPYIYAHIFLLLNHSEVENSLQKVLKEKIILYSLMLNSLRYSDNFIQLIIFKIINSKFINDDDFLNDSNKKLIVSIFSYWVKLSDACIIKMINTSLPSGNISTDKLKTDSSFLKKNFADYDIFKYMQCLICGIYLLSLIKKKKKKESSNLLGQSSVPMNEQSAVFLPKEYNIEHLSLTNFFIDNDGFIHFIGFVFSENKEVINNLFNLIFKLLYFVKNLKFYIIKNVNFKNKYFEEASTFSCINIIYNILDVTKRLLVNSFEIDEYTKNLYKKYLKEKEMTFEHITMYTLSLFINHKDYYICFYAIKVLIILMTDSQIRDSLEKAFIFEIFDSLMSIDLYSEKLKRSEEIKNINNLLFLLIKADIKDNKNTNKSTNIIFSDKQKEFVKYIERICDNDFNLMDLKTMFEFFFVILVKIINIVIKRVQSVLSIEKYKILFMNVYEVVEIFMKELKKDKNKKCRIFFCSSVIYLCHLISYGMYKGKTRSSVPFFNVVFNLIKNVENYLSLMYDDLCTLKDTYEETPEEPVYYSSDSDTKSVKDMHILYFYTTIYNEEMQDDKKVTTSATGGTITNGKNSRINNYHSDSNTNYYYRSDEVPNSDTLNQYRKFMKRNLVKNKENEKVVYNYIYSFFFLCVSNMNKKTKLHIVKSFDLIVKYMIKDEYKINRVKKKSGIFSLPVVIIKDIDNEEKRYNLIIDKYDYILKSFVVDFFKSNRYLCCFLLSVFCFSNTMILFLKKKSFLNDDYSEKLYVLDCFMLINSKTWFYLNVVMECLRKYINKNKVDSFLLRIINLLIENIWKIIIYIFYSVKINTFSIKSKTSSIYIFMRDSLLLFLNFYSTWISCMTDFSSNVNLFSADLMLPELFYKKLPYLCSQILIFFNFIESNLYSLSNNETNISLLIKQKEIMNTILDSMIHLIKVKGSKYYENELNNLIQFKLKLKRIEIPKCIDVLSHSWDYETIFSKAKDDLMNDGGQKNHMFREKLEEAKGSNAVQKDKSSIYFYKNERMEIKGASYIPFITNVNDKTAKHLSEKRYENTGNIIIDDDIRDFYKRSARSVSKSRSPSRNFYSKDKKCKESEENENEMRCNNVTDELKKEAALEKAKKILEKNAALKTQKRAIILNENNSEMNKHQYFKEMKEKRIEVENNVNKYFIMLQEFLEWDFFDLENMEKYRNCIRKEIPIRFNSEEEYHRFFRPMVLEECRCCIMNKMFGDTYKFVINIIGKKKTPNWVIWNIAASNESNTNLDNLKPMDLIVLIPFEIEEKNDLINNNKGTVKYEHLKEILKTYNHLIGLVDVSSNKTENIYDIKLINEDNFPSKLGKEKNRLNVNCLSCNKFHVYFLCNLMTNIREFQSVYISKNSSLFNIILNPTESNNLKETKKKGYYNKAGFHGENKVIDEKKVTLSGLEKYILNTMKSYNLLNESQIEAVKLVFLNKNNISLIQGPPGTGKTKTVIGIVSALYSLINMNNEDKNEKLKKKKDVSHNEQSLSCNKKILVCSPSNSAIDEIAKRILNEGLINFMSIKEQQNCTKHSSSRDNSNFLCNNNSSNMNNKRYKNKMNEKNEKYENNKKNESKDIAVEYNTRNFNIQTITPKCIRIGISKKTHEEIQPISLDYIFNKRKNMEQNLYEVHFNNRKNKLNFSIKAIDHTQRKMHEVRDKLNYNNSKKYCDDYHETKSKTSCEKAENINDFFFEEIVNNVDKKYLEKLLYLFNESYSHYYWSLEKLNSEKKNLEKQKIKLLETDKEVGSFYSNSNKDNMISESEVIFSTLSGSASPVIENLEFEYLVIDEACQCVELSCLIPFRLKIKSIIMVGDPKQLPATTFSEDCRKYGYSRSLFERLLMCNMSSVLLNVQYRMRPEICYFPNKYFYNGLIKNDENLMNRPLFYFHYLNLFGCYKFINIDGIESSTSNKSYINYVEAYFIFRLILYIQNFMTNKNNDNPVPSLYKLSSNFNLKDIGIICPYLSQVHLIRKMFEGYFADNNYPEISTVDAFQGREKNIIIFSCVRSNLQAVEICNNSNEINLKRRNNLALQNWEQNDWDDRELDGLHTRKWLKLKNKNFSNTKDFKAIQKFGNNIGFLKDERRLNVALTRAKDSLWIIGNKSNLEKNITWDSLIKNAIARNCYTNLNLNFNRSTTEDNIKEIIDDFFSHMNNDIRENANCNSIESDINYGICSVSNSEHSTKESRKNNKTLFKERKKFIGIKTANIDLNNDKKNINWNCPSEKEFSFSKVYTDNNNWEYHKTRENGAMENKNYKKKDKKRANEVIKGIELSKKSLKKRKFE